MSHRLILTASPGGKDCCHHLFTDEKRDVQRLSNLLSTGKMLQRETGEGRERSQRAAVPESEESATPAMAGAAVWEPNPRPGDAPFIQISETPAQPPVLPSPSNLQVAPCWPTPPEKPGLVRNSVLPASSWALHSVSAEAQLAAPTAQVLSWCPALLPAAPSGGAGSVLALSRGKLDPSLSTTASPGSSTPHSHSHGQAGASPFGPSTPPASSAIYPGGW